MNATIAEHWGVPVDAVTVTTEAAHGGWIARLHVRRDVADVRMSEVGLTEGRALERLEEASGIRAADERELAAWRARNLPVRAEVDRA